MPSLFIFKLENSVIFMSDVAKIATKQKIIEKKIKVNEIKFACRTQKKQPRIHETKPDVQMK